MTGLSPRERVEAAHTLATEIGDILLAEGRRALIWQQRIRLVRVNLEATGASDEEVLEVARADFDGLYGAPRGFDDFYLARDDPHERVAANQHFLDLVTRLGALLHDS
ncbi:hypothetical protein [Actinoplanes sp. NPDC049802]|uniref:hypothetical protein n=1 Tax=Actinoplanes sp. NPDC049802 TaxID=3154742 RepID=UPI0033D84A42